ncbi:hypothetical protein ACIQV3_38650 [Streptomyces sp. NPDC099050]|uniref:hypothetical protein n=1 Tax=Streptomyces sp. NPDC099050 TaxID=3366100 RepID=UPI003804AFA6
MYLIAFNFSQPPPREELLPERALLGALWSMTQPGDGIEHIRVHPSRAGARGVVFCLAQDGGQAATRVRALCERALREAPALHGWLLSSVDRA